MRRFGLVSRFLLALLLRVLLLEAKFILNEDVVVVHLLLECADSLLLPLFFLGLNFFLELLQPSQLTIVLKRNQLLLQFRE